MSTRLVTGLGLSFCPGVCYSYKDLKFYAMNGCICLHDEEDGSFIVLSCKEFLERAKALQADAMRLARQATDNPGRAKIFAEERNELQNVVADMVSCVQEAKDQGDHHDPTVMQWFLLHRPWQRGRVRRPTHAADFQTTNPGALPRGRYTGRTTKPGHTAAQYRQMAGNRPRHLDIGPAPTSTTVRSGPVKKLILPD
jgi:hypothetical protein